MIPKTPQEEGLDQLELKRDEIETIKADLERWGRLLKLALEYGKTERAKELKNDIGTQEKYLEDLEYEVQELEISDESGSGEGQSNTDNYGSEGSEEERSGTAGENAAKEDPGQQEGP